LGGVESPEQERNRLLRDTFQAEEFAAFFNTRLEQAQKDWENLLAVPKPVVVASAKVEAAAKFDAFSEVVRLMNDVWDETPGAPRSRLWPFFPAETVPAGLSLPPSGANAAAISLKVFRSSFRLLRVPFTYVKTPLMGARQITSFYQHLGTRIHQVTWYPDPSSHCDPLSVGSRIGTG